MDYIDYSQFIMDDDTYWSEIYDYGKSYPDNIANFIRLTNPCLPRPDLQEPILLAYMLMPSALANIYPILFINGVAGSGKSQLAILSGHIHGVDLATPTTTYASARNEIHKRKQAHAVDDDGEKSFEKNTIFIWDDIDPMQFNPKEEMYLLFKIGYNRFTDIISVSDRREAGNNLQYKVGCPKIVASIHPIYLQPECSELKRRCIVIKTVKGTADFEFSLENYNWNGFYKEYNQFWCDQTNINKYISARRKISSMKLSERDRLVVDLIATGVVCSLWDITSGFSLFEQYWNWFDSEIDAIEDALTLTLKQYIKAHAKQDNKMLFEEYLSPRELKKYLDKKQANGELDIKLTPEVLKRYMNNLGWKLVPGTPMAKWMKM